MISKLDLVMPPNLGGSFFLLAGPFILYNEQWQNCQTPWNDESFAVERNVWCCADSNEELKSHSFLHKLQSKSPPSSRRAAIARASHMLLPFWWVPWEQTKHRHRNNCLLNISLKTILTRSASHIASWRRLFWQVSSWVPDSANFPLSRTQIWWAWRTVDKRCATTSITERKGF